MDLPSLLPYGLIHYGAAETDEQLLHDLSLHPFDLVDFFEYAVEDGTWTEKHASFMSGAFEWFTGQFFQDQLWQEWSNRIVKLFQEHIILLGPMLPYDLTVRLEDEECKVNSFLLGTASGVFLEQIRAQCRDSSQKNLVLDECPSKLFKFIAEFVTTGTVSDLWKEDKAVIFALLEQAVRFDLPGLKLLAEAILKRYINQDNAFEMLIDAYQHNWFSLAQSCCDVINAAAYGVQLTVLAAKRIDVSEKVVKPLACEFFDFNDASMKAFEKLKQWITHIVCSGGLTDDPSFSSVITQCLQLVMVDISRSRSFSDQLFYLPIDLQELDISKCPWLSDQYFKKMISLCPKLSKLIVTSNPQLTFRIWSELQNLHYIKSLDVSRNDQINDESFILILKACSTLVELGVENCKKISENGFFEIGRKLPQLVILNTSRSHIDDASLIEIAVRCKYLRELNIAFCNNLSEKGIVQVVRQARNLILLNISGCKVSERTLKEIKGLQPYLELV